MTAKQLRDRVQLRNLGNRHWAVAVWDPSVEMYRVSDPMSYHLARALAQGKRQKALREAQLVAELEAANG